MPIRVSTIRTIAYSISFLITGSCLFLLLQLPWPHFYWTLVAIATAFYFSLGFLGIYGSMLEKWSILCLYANIVIIVVICKVFLILVLVVAIKNAMSTVEQFLQLLISEYDRNFWYKEKIDYIQEMGQCCGIYGHWNWYNSLAPKSCCMATMNFRNSNGTESFVCKFYENGCLLQFEDKFVMACIVMILVLAIKIILNVCAIVDGFYLVKKYRQLANKHVSLENQKE